MNENKELDDFIKKMVKEAGLESPSSNFTHQVLGKIQIGTLQNPATVYQPLISRNTWAVLAFLLLGLFFYSLFGMENDSNSWLSPLNMDFLSKYDVFTEIASISISETTTYSIIGISIFIYIQLFVLKRYMDVRFNLG